MNKNATQIVCTVTFLAKLNEEEALIKNIEKITKLTRLEGGCIRYELSQSITNSRELILVEKWASQADLDAHLNTPYLKNFAKEPLPDHVESMTFSVGKELF